MNDQTDRFRRLAWIIFLTMMLIACKPVPLTRQPTRISPTEETPTLVPAIPSATVVQMPTATQLAPLAVLFAPSGSDLSYAESVRSKLEEPILQAGLRWEMRTELDLQEAGLRLVISLPPDPGIENLAANNPQVQFVSIGMRGVQPAGNLSVVRGEVRYDQQGFLAGVIAAMITPDWRVGVVSVADTPAGKAARNGFLNGAVFFCGLCQAYHGPIFDYPQYVDIPSNPSQADWQMAVETLKSRAVRTVYVFPEVAQPGLLDAFAQEGVDILSSGIPTEISKNQWVASIDMDPISPLLSFLPDLIAGKGGMDAVMPIVIQVVNPSLFSPGRQGLAEKILSDLENGEIDTGIDPLSGENR